MGYSQPVCVRVCVCIDVRTKFSRRKGTLPFPRPCRHVNAPSGDHFKAALMVKKRATTARRCRCLRAHASRRVCVYVRACV